MFLYCLCLAIAGDRRHRPHAHSSQTVNDGPITVGKIANAIFILAPTPPAAGGGKVTANDLFLPGTNREHGSASLLPVSRTGHSHLAVTALTMPASALGNTR